MVFEAMRDAGCEDAAGCMMFGTNPFEDKVVADTLGIDFKYTNASNTSMGSLTTGKKTNCNRQIDWYENVSAMPSQSSKSKMQRGRP